MVISHQDLGLLTAYQQADLYRFFYFLLLKAPDWGVQD